MAGSQLPEERKAPEKHVEQNRDGWDALIECRPGFRCDVLTYDVLELTLYSSLTTIIMGTWICVMMVIQAENNLVCLAFKGP